MRIQSAGATALHLLLLLTLLLDVSGNEWLRGDEPALPLRLGTGIHDHGNRWNAAAEIRWADDQDKVAENETPTEGYPLVGASLGYRWQLGGQVLDLLPRARNLTDEEARSHTSFLKDVAPLLGRNLTLSARLRF